MDLNFATAHLIGFLQRKKIIAGGKPVLADFGTLTCVVYYLGKIEVPDVLSQ